MTDASLRSRTTRRLSPWTTGAVSSVLILIVSACGQGAPQAGRNSARPINDIPCDIGERLAFHIHAHLAIYAGGQPLEVPYGIGIGEPWQVVPGPEGPFVIAGSCFRWLHTHTADGIIHIESPVQRTFTLGDYVGAAIRARSLCKPIRSFNSISATRPHRSRFYSHPGSELELRGWPIERLSRRRRLRPRARPETAGRLTSMRRRLRVPRG
jgi:hypothetical protein